MILSVAELMLIIDTLDKTLMIQDRGLFTFDRDTREKVRDHLVKELNRLKLSITIEEEHATGQVDAPGNPQ